MNKRVVLIGFHNEKALGVRYLSVAARAHGYEPIVVFFKGFNSEVPEHATDTELKLLQDFIREKDPILVGLSAMSSLYFETLQKVNAAVRAATSAPVAWGGVLASLDPAVALQYADFVMRAEGEETLIDVLRAIETGGDIKSIDNIAYLNEDGSVHLNPIRPLVEDIDKFGHPPVNGKDMHLITNNKLTPGDPQVHAFTYELLASRGCPFSCTYCSAINLHRLYGSASKYVRFRSVDSVLSELNEAKANIPKLRVVHFWDEVFSNEPGWVDEFCARYKKEIGIPFRIWGHPMMVNEDLITKLVDAGLYQVVMGIQSGSERVRRDVFHRYEPQDRVIEATHVLSRCKVPHVFYDLMLLHAFESPEDLRQTFEMCLELEPPFELNIHGLNYLPGTDIVDMAIQAGYYTPEEMHSMMYSSLQEQYDRHWGPAASVYKQASTGNPWISLIYLTQFPELHDQLRAFADKLDDPATRKAVFALEVKMKKRQRLVHFINKVKLVLRIK